VLTYSTQTHISSRRAWGLPPLPPQNPEGVQCSLCSNMCLIGEGEKGYCGLRTNIDGHLKSLSDPYKGVLHAYRDPHPTNCCSAWFCPGGTGAGYPHYSHREGVEKGFSNLSVFFYGCNFDCLFCQNASHKRIDPANQVSLEDLAQTVREEMDYSCICYFGGSPEPQLPFATRVSEVILEENPERIIRICFEWNGCGDPDLVKKAADLSLKSGGNLKFDLKSFDEKSKSGSEWCIQRESLH